MCTRARVSQQAKFCSETDLKLLYVPRVGHQQNPCKAHAIPEQQTHTLHQFLMERVKEAAYCTQQLLHEDGHQRTVTMSSLLK